MNRLSCSLFLCFLSLVLSAEHNTTYTTKYDNVDLDEILASERLLTGYVNCLLEKSACTPDGKELKSNLPDAINDGCLKCSEKQRVGSERVMHHIIDHRADDWAKLELKYDPDGHYKINYLKEKTLKEQRDKIEGSEEEPKT